MFENMDTTKNITITAEDQEALEDEKVTKSENETTENAAIMAESEQDLDVEKVTKSENDDTSFDANVQKTTIINNDTSAIVTENQEALDDEKVTKDINDETRFDEKVQETQIINNDTTSCMESEEKDDNNHQDGQGMETTENSSIMAKDQEAFQDKEVAKCGNDGQKFEEKLQKTATSNNDLSCEPKNDNHQDGQEKTTNDNKPNKPHIVNIPMTDEELGIYDDPGDSDGLSDTELAIAADDHKEKTPGKVTTFKTSGSVKPGTRKSSRIGAYSKLGPVPSGYRGVANTPAAYSEYDESKSSVRWSARKPMDIFISRKPVKSESKAKLINQSSRIASRNGHRSAESR